jgi:hypothetical protein
MTTHVWRNNSRLWLEQNTTSLHWIHRFKKEKNWVTWYWTSARLCKTTNSGICQCVQNYKKRMTSVTRPYMSSDHTGQKQDGNNIYSQLSGLEDVTRFPWFHQGWFYSRRWSSSRISSVSLPQPGVSVRIRRSKDLEDWERVGWV